MVKAIKEIYIKHLGYYRMPLGAGGFHVILREQAYEDSLRWLGINRGPRN